MPLGNAYIKLSEIITDAAQELRQDEFGALGRPFYVSAAQRGLTELNYATQFHKKEWIEAIPESLILELPGDLTEMDQAYVAQMDGCNIGETAILYIKPNMWHKGAGGYFAQQKGRNYDATQYSIAWSQSPPNCLYYAGERDGKLFFSPSCRERFGHVVIPYSGIGVDCFGEDFQVPMWARVAITDYVVHRAAMALERTDPQHLRGVIQRKEMELKSSQGSWMTAIVRYKRLDKKGRFDNNATNFRFGHYQ